jgi:ABC-2 type transport system permease protein
MQTFYLFWRAVKWRFQNPITIIMTLLQPLIWLVLYSSIFANSSAGNYTAFILAGILVLVVFASSGNSGVSTYASKTDGSFYRIHIAPVKRSAIVLGHVLDATVLSFIEIGVLLLVAWGMSVRIASGPAGLGLMGLLLLSMVFFMACLSYDLSLILPNENVFFTLMTTIILPVFFVSTALLPLEQIPSSWQKVVNANPFTHVINSLRNLILNPLIDWQLFGLALSMMLGLGVIFFGLSVRRLQHLGEI